jgi:hypothetical protein
MLTEKYLWESSERLTANRKLLLDQQMSEVFRPGVRITNDKS